MRHTDEKTRLVFGVTGASGIPLAKGILECFLELSFLEIHLIISNSAKAVAAAECPDGLDALTRLSRKTYEADDFSAPPASGSWLHNGMIICPCSMSSLASIATGCGSTLIHRAADVCLKERRPLILVPRESPLNLIQLKNMLGVTEAGGCVMPFSPAFYTPDASMEGMFRQFAGRLLDLLRAPNDLCFRWEGPRGSS